MNSTESSSQKIAHENFKRWAESLKTKNPQEVASLYAEDATFLPTVSPDFKIGTEEAKGCFEHFLKKNPEGEITLDKLQVLGENAYLHSGMYDFQLGESGNKQSVKARFSFVWKKESGGEWKIIHYHSSVCPQ